MTEQQNQVISNFLSTLDLEMPMVDHYKNAMKDALTYKWPSSMLVKIIAGIEDAYKGKV